MTRKASKPEAPDPDDSPQHDIWASRLSELVPSSANALQAQAFYRAGIQAAKGETQRPHASQWLTRAAVVALLVGSSSLSYMAGLSQRASTNLASSEPAEATPETISSVNEKTNENSAMHSSSTVEAQVDSRSTPPHESFSLGSQPSIFRSPIAEWLGLTLQTPAEYLQMVEARTAPQSVNYVASETALNNTLTEEALLREFYGTPRTSPLRRWPSM